MSKEEWVAAQSIKIIGNTAIPVVKLKTQILRKTINDDGGNIGCNMNISSNYVNEKKNNNDYNNNNNNNDDINNDDINNDDNNNNNKNININNTMNNNINFNNDYCTTQSTSYSTPHTSSSCLNLDISFEGPGHYGLEANKLTKSLIKVSKR